VNKLLDEIKKVAAGGDVVIGGDFNLTVSNWLGPERVCANCSRSVGAAQHGLVGGCRDRFMIE
jgi:hypothetical protein